MLSRIVVELKGGLGLSRARLGGKSPLPDPTNKILLPSGVAPLIICTGGVIGTYQKRTKYYAYTVPATTYRGERYVLRTRWNVF